MATTSEARPGRARGVLAGALLLAAVAGCSTGPRSAPLPAALDADAPATTAPTWLADSGRGIEVAPLRQGDSLLVAGTDRRLVLYEAGTGKRLWRRRLGGSPVGPPQVAQGYLVVTTAPPDGGVYLYDLRHRKPLWKQAVGDPAGPARLFENVVLVPTRDGRVQGLAPSDGRTVWVTNLETRVSGDAVFVPEQALLLVPGRNGTLYAVDTRGGEKRWVTTGDDPLVAVAADTGLVVATGLSGTLYGAWTLNGRPFWRVPTAAPITAPAALSARRVVVATLDGQLLGIDRLDGRLAWRRALGGPFRGAPAVTPARGLVAAVSGELFRFDPATGRVLGRARHPEPVLAAPVGGATGEWFICGEWGRVGGYRWPGD